MATLTLTKTWVNLVSTGQAVSGYTDPDRPEGYRVPGRMGTYANGRRRSISSTGEEGVLKIVLVDVPRATADTLRGWQGQLVQVRDNIGRRFFGVYYSLDPKEIRGTGTYTVEFTLNVASYDEAV